MALESMDPYPTGSAEHAATYLTTRGLGCSHPVKYHVDGTNQVHSKYPSRLGFFHFTAEEPTISFLDTRKLCNACLDIVVPNGFNFWSTYSIVNVTSAAEQQAPKPRWLKLTPSSDSYPPLVQAGTEGFAHVSLAMKGLPIRSTTPPVILPIPEVPGAKEAWNWLQIERKPFYIDQLHLIKGWSLIVETRAKTDSLIAELAGIGYRSEAQPKTQDRKRNSSGKGTVLLEKGVGSSATTPLKAKKKTKVANKKLSELPVTTELTGGVAGPRDIPLDQPDGVFESLKANQSEQHASLTPRTPSKAGKASTKIKSTEKPSKKSSTPGRSKTPEKGKMETTSVGSASLGGSKKAMQFTFTSLFYSSVLVDYSPAKMNSNQSASLESLETTGKLSQSRSQLVKQKVSKNKPLDPRRIGLHKLFEPEEVEDIEVDILAIHGIGANPDHTWVDRKTQVNWLKDPTMLPDALPNARIMAYNYESSWFGENAVKQSLRGVAEKLLRAIIKARSECLDRPIILIGHCFGGLVALQCYVLANQHQEQYEGFSHSVIAGMMFLGTPFYGISHDSGMTKLGEIYQAIATSDVHVEDNIWGTIAEENDILVAAVADFLTYLGKSSNSFKPKLFCFYETKPSKIGRVAGLDDTKPKFLVSESSGTLHGHEKESLYKDHFEINKFVANDDDNYKIVLRELKKMNNNAMELIEARRTGCLKQAQTAQSRALPISKENHFAPRDGILKDIEEKLSMKPCVALYGGPGNGKTHVAVEYAHTYSQNSQGRVHWVHAETAAGFESSYKCIADIRGINREGMKIDEVLSAVCKSLSQDSNWLMVLDGCGDEILRKMTHVSGPKKALLDYVPKTGHASVLATTRSKEIAMKIADDNRKFMKEVKELKDADAALLMLGKNTKDPSKRLKAISRANELGGSAGTLVLAQLYQKKARVDSKKYVDHIRKVQTDDNKSRFTRPWRLLYDLMEETHPEAAHLLLQMGSMDAQCIPNEILERDQLYKQVPQLEDYGMVEPSPDKRFVILTPIIRECVQKHLDENGDRKLVEGQVLDLPSSKLHSYEHRLAEIMLPCALAALMFQPSADHALKFAALHSEVAKLYTRIQQDELAVRHWEQAIHRYEENPDDNHIQVEDAKKALEEARERAQLNEADSKVTAKKGAVISKSHRKRQALLECEGSDGEAIDVGREHLNIALAREAKGEYGEAKKHYVAALRIAELNYGPESPIALQIMGKLASIHNKQGQQKDAEQALQATLEGQEKAVGADHPDTLKTRRDMAMLLADKGYVDAAEVQLTRVLIAQLQLLGLENPDTLQTGRALAINYCWRGSPEKGESLLRETLSIQKRVLGEKHSDTTRTAVNLKELLEQMKM
ncbi:hypothetical protein F5Y09DRAFT_327017 [Xylaria sp. FL1042]|nr:hypothetical protein F5Y09DRAFT_327017 [Xylaria sp. FL1042]